MPDALKLDRWDILQRWSSAKHESRHIIAYVALSNSYDTRAVVYDAGLGCCFHGARRDHDDAVIADAGLVDSMPTLDAFGDLVHDAPSPPEGGFPKLEDSLTSEEAGRYGKTVNPSWQSDTERIGAFLGKRCKDPDTWPSLPELRTWIRNRATEIIRTHRNAVDAVARFLFAHGVIRPVDVERICAPHFDRAALELYQGTKNLSVGGVADTTVAAAAVVDGGRPTQTQA